MHKKLIRQYYVLSFLFSATGAQIIGATYVTFLLKNGLTLLEANLINASFFLTLFVCEIPTGAFADTFGRKRSFVAACFFMSLGMFIYGLSHSFFGFICAEIVAAVGATFKTGAFQAWLVDSLKHHGYKGSYTKIFGRATITNQIGGGAGAIIGSYIAAYNLSYPWFVAGTGIALVGTLALFTMKEEYFVQGNISWKQGLSSMRQVASTSFRYASEQKAVRFILIITFVEIYSVQALNMYWQPFFQKLGVSISHNGFVYTGMMSLIALGGLLVSYLHSENKERSWVLRAMVYVGVMIALASVSKTLWFAVPFFLLHEVGRGFWNPLQDNYLQQRIPSHERATIVSFCAVAPHIGGAIGLVISGLIAQMFGITTSWLVASGVLVGGAFLLRKNRNST